MKRNSLQDCTHCGHLIVEAYGQWMHLSDTGLALHCPDSTVAEPSPIEVNQEPKA